MGRDEIIEGLQNIYKTIKTPIENKFRTFEEIGRRNDCTELFRELAFCILTPQSKATAAWEAIEKLTENRLLFEGSPEEIQEYIRRIRFMIRKSQYIVEARERFYKKGDCNFFQQFPDTDEPKKFREWLVKNMKGYGYKEASHFLRNTGKGPDLAILDRHIIKILQRCSLIDSIPSSITGKKYLEIEEVMVKFSVKTDIPLHHLDFVMWYEATGTIFK